VIQVARVLGIADHLLYRWQVEQQEAESHGHTHKSRCAEYEELRRLRQEHATLKSEWDFFKRTAAFFAQESR
jgi:transposase-like protein